MTERRAQPDSETEHGPRETGGPRADPLAGLPAAPEHNPLWEDTPHRPGDPPLRRLPPELAPNTPGGRTARALGRQLRAWRERHRLTQREVAERLGWEQPAVARLEGGAVAPTSTTLALLAARLTVRITFGGGEGDVVIADAAPATVASAAPSE
jgi:hypothetical protein